MIKKTGFLLVCGLLLCGCKNDFATWRSLNDTWMANHAEQIRAQMNQSDTIRGISDTGLQYEIFHKGFGKTPKSTSLIKVTYATHLIDGTLVESSTESILRLGQCVQAWQEMLSTLQAGSSCRIYAPADLCYGAKGTRNTRDVYIVPPYSALIFDIKLIDVQQQQPDNDA